MTFKNKKAVMAYQEILLIAFSILLIGISLYMVTKFSNTANNDFTNLAPEISYQFPATYVHSFLMMPIDKSDIGALNLNKSKSYYVKDLIILDTTQSMDLVKNKYKENYIEKFSQASSEMNAYDYYKLYSADTFKADKNTLLYFKQYSGNLPSLDDAIKNKNYFFYVKNLNGKYTLIYFKTPIETQTTYTSDTSNQAENIVWGA